MEVKNVKVTLNLWRSNAIRTLMPKPNPDLRLYLHTT